jgi:hypothetical protein
VIAAFALVWTGLVEYATTGHVTMHWSRALVAVSLLQIALFSVVSRVLQKVIELWSGQLAYVAGQRE